MAASGEFLLLAVAAAERLIAILDTPLPAVPAHPKALPHDGPPGIVFDDVHLTPYRARAAKAACRLEKQQGNPVSLLVLKTLWPVPERRCEGRWPG